MLAFQQKGVRTRFIRSGAKRVAPNEQAQVLGPDDLRRAEPKVHQLDVTFLLTTFRTPLPVLLLLLPRSCLCPRSHRMLSQR